MAIHIFCTLCKTSCGLDAKECSKCGTAFGRDKKFRVCVSFKGKRSTRVVDNLTLARQKEATLKADLERGDMDIKKKKPAPTLAEVWEKYLPWAKEEKKTWDDDLFNYRKHLEPRFGKKRLDEISPIDIERMKQEMKKEKSKQGKPFSKATIKHQMVLLNRLYNLAHRWELYKGDNPLDKIDMPKLDNLRTEFLTAEQFAALWKTLETWPCEISMAFIKLSVFTGVRRSELFRLTWDDVDVERSILTLLVKDTRNKDGRRVKLDISPEAMEILKGLPRTSVFTFPGKDGQQRTDFKGQGFGCVGTR